MKEKSSRFLPGLLAFLALVYAIAIFALSSITGEQMAEAPPPLFPHADKVAHFLLYAGFGVVIYLAFSRAENERIRALAIPLTIIAGIVYGITDEAHQYFVPGREMDVIDMIVDSLGVLAALGGIVLFNKMRKSE